MPSSPEALEGIPQWLQWAGGLAFAILLTFNGLKKFFVGFAEPEVARNVVLEQAEVADMTAIRTLSAKLQTLTDLMIASQQAEHDFRVEVKAYLERIDRLVVIADRLDQERRWPTMQPPR